MDLLEEAFEDFTVINKIIVSDGYGGTTTRWEEGAVIKGAMAYNSSSQVRIAQAIGDKSVYLFTVRKFIELDLHTVLKRNKDNHYFRLTNNSDDKKTPNSAGLNMRQYNAEEWSLAE